MSNKDLENLNWDIQPERDLWPEIQAGIRFRKQEKHSHHGSNWMPMAVAACLMLAVGAFVMSSMSFYQTQQTHQMQANYIGYQKAQIALMEQEHAAVRAQFVSLLDNDFGNANPEIADELRMFLETIDMASAEIKQAMLVQPLNSKYPTKLARTYQEELNLLNKIKSQGGVSI